MYSPGESQTKEKTKSPYYIYTHYPSNKKEDRDVRIYDRSVLYDLSISCFTVIAESFVIRCRCASSKDRKVGLALLLARTPETDVVNSQTWASP